MVLTSSSMIPLGTQAPDFLLVCVCSNKKISYEDVQRDKGTVVMFICNHCPFVKHVIKEVSLIAKEYNAHGIGFCAINSNDAKNYPEDSPENMVVFAKKYNFTFPYLFDETQEVAKAYDAACTPDFFVFDANKRLFYRGRIDDSSPGNNKLVTGKDLRAALDALIAGKMMPEDQRPSIGCNIKWK